MIDVIQFKNFSAEFQIMHIYDEPLDEDTYISKII